MGHRRPAEKKTPLFRFLLRPVFVTWLVLEGALESGIQPSQSAEIGLLEGGEKWCKITRGNIRPNLETGGEKKQVSHELKWSLLGGVRDKWGEESWWTPGTLYILHSRTVTQRHSTDNAHVIYSCKVRLLSRRLIRATAGQRPLEEAMSQCPCMQ